MLVVFTTLKESINTITNQTFNEQVNWLHTCTHTRLHNYIHLSHSHNWTHQNLKSQHRDDSNVRLYRVLTHELTQLIWWSRDWTYIAVIHRTWLTTLQITYSISLYPHVLLVHIRPHHQFLSTHAQFHGVILNYDTYLNSMKLKILYYPNFFTMNK